jgi:hypothetical protein
MMNLAPENRKFTSSRDGRAQAMTIWDRETEETFLVPDALARQYDTCAQVAARSDLDLHHRALILQHLFDLLCVATCSPRGDKAQWFLAAHPNQIVSKLQAETYAASASIVRAMEAVGATNWDGFPFSHADVH